MKRCPAFVKKSRGKRECQKEGEAVEKGRDSQIPREGGGREKKGKTQILEPLPSPAERSVVGGKRKEMPDAVSNLPRGEGGEAGAVCLP